MTPADDLGAGVMRLILWDSWGGKPGMIIVH